MLPKIPRNNLAPLSQPWARWVDDAYVDLANRADKLAIDDGINSRSAHAVVDTLQTQVKDLESRQPQSVTLPVRSGTGSGTYTLADVSFMGPNTGGRVLFKANITLGKSLSSIAGPAASMTVKLNGTTILTNAIISYRNTGTPPDWYYSQPKNVNFFGTVLLRQLNTLTVTYTTVAPFPADYWTFTGNVAVFPE